MKDVLPRRVVFLLVAATVALTYQLVGLASGLNGRLAADYGYFLPRLVDGVLFLRKQGLAIPWYTASYCAGLPFFADVQSQFYSLPQLLTMWIDPLTAATVSTVCYLACGSLAFALFARRVCGFSPLGAALVYLCFFGNGYVQARALAGHMTHVVFALIPVVGYLLTEPRVRQSTASIAAGAVLALMIHSGFHYGCLLVPPAIGYFLLCSRLWGEPGSMLSLSQLVWRVGVAAGVALSLSLAKLVAAWALYTHASVPPPTEFLSLPHLWQAVLLSLSQLFLFGTYEPAPWPSYEFDCMLNPILAVGLLLSLARQWRRAPSEFSTSGRPRIVISLLALTLLCFLVGTGLWGASSLLMSSPVTRSFRVHLRLLAVLMFPAILFGCRALSQCRSSRHNLVAFAAVALSVLPGERLRQTSVALAAKTYVISRADIDTFANQANTRIVEAMVVTRIGAPFQNVPSLSEESGGVPDSHGAADEDRPAGVPNEQDIASRIIGESNQTCYFPLFGRYPYRLSPGFIRVDVDGKFNVVNPSCYVFPEENACKPGERIRAEEERRLRRLLNYEDPGWRVSALERIALQISFLSTWGLLAVVLLPLLFRLLGFGRQDARRG